MLPYLQSYAHQQQEIKKQTYVYHLSLNYAIVTFERQERFLSLFCAFVC